MAGKKITPEFSEGPARAEPMSEAQLSEAPMSADLFVGIELEEDAKELLRLAHILAQSKTENADIVSITTVFIAAVEWGQGPDHLSPPPQPLRQLATLIEELGAQDYAATKAEYLTTDTPLLNGASAPQGVIRPSRSLYTVIYALAASDRPVTAARICLALLAHVRNGRETETFLKRFGKLGDLNTLHYAAALLRRGVVDHVLQATDPDHEEAIRERPIWRYIYDKDGMGPFANGKASEIQVKISGGVLKRGGPRGLQAGDVIALWNEGSKQPGLVGWAQAVSGPDDLQRVTIRLRDAFPDDPIAEGDILSLLPYHEHGTQPFNSILETFAEEEPIYRHLFSTAEESTEPDTETSDLTPSSDRAETTRDLLERGPLAFSLASLINAVQDDQGRAKGDEAAFVMHIDSPWGGGKTTFANYVTRLLNASHYGLDPEQPKDGQSIFATLGGSIARRWPEHWKDRRWIPVTFNAWEHQHVSPPWWDLYQTTRKGFRGSLGFWGRIGNMLFEWGWRLWMPAVRYPVIGLMLFAPVLFGVAVLTGVFETSDTAPTSPLATLSQKSDGSTPGGWGLFLTLLVGGSGLALFNTVRQGLQKIVVTAGSTVDRENLGDSDPMDRLRRRFARQMARLNKGNTRPLIVVIDDLDRCDPAYVVELMRGLLTIFKSPDVVYLMLGDKRWIESAFATVYEGMNLAPPETDVSFGARFVEKVIQMSFLLPEAEASVRDAYFDALLIGNDGQKAPSAAFDAQMKNARTALRDSQDSATVELRAAELKDRVSQITDLDDAQKSQLARAIDVEAVIQTSAAPELRRNISHQLARFKQFLPSNPRRIKRIINMVAIYQSSARVLLGIRPGTQAWKQMVLWVILMSEQPALWEHLSHHPLDADLLQSDGEDARLRCFRETPQALAILRGGGEADLPALDSDAVEQLAQLTPC